MRWPAKNASSYLSRGSCDFRRLLIHTVFGASNRDRTIARADLSWSSNQRICKPKSLADRQQVLRRQRHAAVADLLRRALDVGKIVVPRFLPDANQQLRELLARGRGLAQQLRQRDRSRSWENRNPGSSGIAASPPRAAGFGSAASSVFWSRNQPGRLAEDSRQQREHVVRRHALTVLDHAEVRNRRRCGRIDLHAARRQLLERQTIALAQ